MKMEMGVRRAGLTGRLESCRAVRGCSETMGDSGLGSTQFGSKGGSSRQLSGNKDVMGRVAAFWSSGKETQY